MLRSILHFTWYKKMIIGSTALGRDSVLNTSSIQGKTVWEISHCHVTSQCPVWANIFLIYIFKWWYHYCIISGYLEQEFEHTNLSTQGNEGIIVTQWKTFDIYSQYLSYIPKYIIFVLILLKVLYFITYIRGLLRTKKMLVSENFRINAHDLACYGL